MYNIQTVLSLEGNDFKTESESFKLTITYEEKESQETKEFAKQSFNVTSSITVREDLPTATKEANIIREDELPEED